MNKVPVAPDAPSKSYYNFYMREMPDIPSDKLAVLDDPFGQPGRPLEISERRHILEPGYLPAEVGLFELREGGYLLANRTEFPGSTGKMLQWFYAWHAADPLRYAVWEA